MTAGTGQPPRVTVHHGRADGSFDARAAVVSELKSFSAFVLGDVTGDGRADVLAQGTGAPRARRMARVPAGLSTPGTLV